MSCHCGRVGLYRVGRDTFCKTHVCDAKTLLRSIRRRDDQERVSVVFDEIFDQKEKALKRMDRIKAQCRRRRK